MRSSAMKWLASRSASVATTLVGGVVCVLYIFGLVPTWTFLIVIGLIGVTVIAQMITTEQEIRRWRAEDRRDT